MYYCICFCNKFSITLSRTIHFNDSITYYHSWPLCTNFHEVFISWTIHLNYTCIHDQSWASHWVFIKHGHSWPLQGVCIRFQDVFTSCIIRLNYTFITDYIWHILIVELSMGCISVSKLFLSAKQSIWITLSFLIIVCLSMGCVLNVVIIDIFMGCVLTSRSVTVLGKC